MFTALTLGNVTFHGILADTSQTTLAFRLYFHTSQPNCDLYTYNFKFRPVSTTNQLPQSWQSHSESSAQYKHEFTISALSADQNYQLKLDFDCTRNGITDLYATVTSQRDLRTNCSGEY